MQHPDVDEEGYLIEPATWSEDVAKAFAHQEDTSYLKIIGMRFTSCANIMLNIKSHPMFVM